MTHHVTLNHDELRGVVADVLDVEPELITNDVDFIDDLGVDSLVALELAVTLERHFKIRIESNEIVDVRTMADVVALMTAKLDAA